MARGWALTAGQPASPGHSYILFFSHLCWAAERGSRCPQGRSGLASTHFAPSWAVSVRAVTGWVWVSSGQEAQSQGQCHPGSRGITPPAL